MNARHLAAVVLFFLVKNLAAQNCQPATRYAAPVFSCVQPTLNIQYGSGLHNWGYTNLLCLTGGVAPPYQNQLPLFLDFYEPCNDTATRRPLVVMIHGGGWAGGDKSDFAAFATSIAQCGYAVASINYRLANPSNTLCWDAEVDSIKMLRAMFRAVQDAKAAVRFFRANAAAYRIDTCNIFVAGHSAGAFTALGVGYLNKNSEKPAADGPQSYCGDWFGSPFCTDLGSVEGESGSAGHSSAVSGVIALSGGWPTLDIFDKPAPPLLMAHGTADDVVLYAKGCLVPVLINSNIFHRCITVFGSSDIQTHCQQTGLESSLITFVGGGHGFTTEQADTILQAAIPFLCSHYKPTDCSILPTKLIENQSEISAFKLSPNPTSGRFFIETAAPSGGSAQLEIFDFSGKKCFDQTLDSAGGEVVFEPPTAGLFLVKWTTSERVSRSQFLVVE